MKKLNVLFLTNIPSPYSVHFFNELGKHTNLTVLFERKTADNRDDSWYYDNAINFRAIYLNGKKCGEESALCLGVFKFLKMKNDVIIIGNYSSPTGILSILYLRAKKIQFCIHADGGIVSNESHIKYKIKSLLISSASGYFSPGKITNDYFIHYGNGSKIYTYPFTSLRKSDLCTEVQSYKNKRIMRIDRGMPDENMVVLYVGRVIHQKGIDILINAMKNIPSDVGLHIIGGDPTDELLENMHNINAKNIYFHGFMNFEEIKEIMRVSDIFAFPTRFDIWGLVVNEALAQGLPVITTQSCVSGIELITDYVNGFIVPTDDPEALADKINYFYVNREKIYEMSQNCLKTAQLYTIENMAQVYLRNIEKFHSEIITHSIL